MITNLIHINIPVLIKITFIKNNDTFDIDCNGQYIDARFYKKTQLYDQLRYDIFDFCDENNINYDMSDCCDDIESSINSIHFILSKELFAIFYLTFKKKYIEFKNNSDFV